MYTHSYKFVLYFTFLKEKLNVYLSNYYCDLFKEIFRYYIYIIIVFQIQ